MPQPGSQLVRGSKLPDDLQLAVLARWSNRHYSKPGKVWTKADDKEWLSRHQFWITPDGKIDMTVSECDLLGGRG